MPSTQGKAIPDTRQQGENTRRFGALPLLMPKEWHVVPCQLKEPLSRPLPQGRAGRRATKGSRHLQLPLEGWLWVNTLANSSVLSQRLRSPGCKVLSGRTEMEQSGEMVGREPGQVAMGETTYLVTCFGLLYVTGRNSE